MRKQPRAASGEQPMATAMGTSTVVEAAPAMDGGASVATVVPQLPLTTLPAHACTANGCTM